VDAIRREAGKEARDVRDQGLAERVPSPELVDAEVERRDDAHRVRMALRELPSDQRRVIELAYFGGFSHTQIADILELPTGTVKGRMRIGLSKLRLSLSAERLLP
jgi:RNA polymerase sigma-70 factor (ECF subfamily)